VLTILSKFLCLPLAVFFVGAGVACTRTQKFIDVTTPMGTAKLPVSETLRLNLITEPPSLDWIISSDSTSTEVLINLMDGLVSFNLADKNLGLAPALASRWEANKKATIWTFTLRDDVKWSDGQPFTAQQVLDGWERLLDRKTASTYAYYLFGVKNARAFHEGKVAFTEVGVKISAPHQITVELERPMSFFPSLLTHHSTWPVRLDVIAKHGNRWTDPGNIVTLGAYTLKAWEHDHLIALERNDNYFDTKAKAKYIVGYMLTEQATAINLYDAGKLDVVDKVASIERRKLRGRPDFYETPGLQIYYYGLNVTKPPMNNPLVRRALSQAIDRKEIVQMLGGGQNPMTNWIPIGMFGYEPDLGLGFNIEKARQALDQAGYKDRSKFPRIELAFNTNEDHMRIGENVQAQLERNLGIKMELRNLEWKVYLSLMQSDPPQMFRFGWNADYPDPDNFFALLTSFSENNHMRWKNLAFDALISDARAELSSEKRRAIYVKAQKILVEQDVPVIPIYSKVEATVVSPRVENFPFNSMSIRSYKGVRLK
jgi:oligopeptide transport system substrate-binding protein